MALKSYRELIAWQKAMDLAENVYRHTSRFPREEVYGLTSQIRRSAVSVPSNISEGQGRRSTRDFHHFLSIARGSLCEMETQVLLSERLGYLDARNASELLNQAAEVGRLINGLSKSLPHDKRGTGPVVAK
jgi:four helix bundle protein